MRYTNNDILSRLSEKLTKQLAKYGSNKPISISLWSEDVAPVTFMDKIYHVFGKFHSKSYTSLVVRFSPETGYSLQGASWDQINSRLDWNVTTLAKTIARAIHRDYNNNHGWENSLTDTMAELDELELS